MQAARVEVSGPSLALKNRPWLPPVQSTCLGLMASEMLLHSELVAGSNGRYQGSFPKNRLLSTPIGLMKWVLFGERDVLTEEFGDRGEILFESFPT